MQGYLRTEKSVISAYKAEPNADGTYTVYVGSNEGGKYRNHVEMPEGGASITLRLYRPTDIESAKSSKQNSEN